MTSTEDKRPAVPKHDASPQGHGHFTDSNRAHDFYWQKRDVFLPAGDQEYSL